MNAAEKAAGTSQSHDRADTSGAAIQLVVVTPEATILDKRVDFVALPLYDGEIGIARGRAPMIGRLGYGELRLVEDAAQAHYYVDGGFVQVAGNVVSVLTPRAVRADSIDSPAAAELLAAARARKANSEELLELRDRLERQARAQLRLAERAKQAGHRSEVLHRAPSLGMVCGAIFPGEPPGLSSPRRFIVPLRVQNAA